MKIAIIGAGFTGLAAGYRLLKLGHEVAIFERDSKPGGLAVGYREREWDWSLEHHYHHWFTSDKHIIKLAKEVNFPVFIRRPKTSVYVDNRIFQLDSPRHVLSFPKLSLIEKLRMAGTLAFLRYNPFWQPLEKVKMTGILPLAMGKNSYTKLWEPQIFNKFGKYSDEISLTWFWSRIKNRTPDLAYPAGGFLEFANFLVKKIEEMGGKVRFNAEAYEIKSKNRITITLKNKEGIKLTTKFDKSIVTLPSFLFLKIAPSLPSNYKSRLGILRGIGATNLILRLKKPFLTEGTYWLSICERNSPIMAIVEHTNFMDKKSYNNEHIVYLGKYLSPNDPFYNMDADKLLTLYDPFLKRISPSYKKSLIGYQLFKTPFAQSIVALNYSKMIPPFKTPLKNVYLANIQQVYPWDRGTNYAVELAEKVVDTFFRN